MHNIIVMEDGKASLQESIIKQIIEVEDKIKELKEIQDNYKKAIMSCMEELGLLKISDEVRGLYINYIEAKENLEKFNAIKLKEEKPDLYDEYVTFDGKKSAYITIKRK